jgi:crotonobetainyl-CoA:carnitine CoA-transferase CaiB-like acyl-CoA transferase
MTAIGRPDLTGPSFAENHHRVAQQKIIEKAIQDWTSRHTPEEVCDAMESAKVPYGKIMNVKDLVECEHLIARGMVEEVHVGDEAHGRGWMLKVPGVAPKLEGECFRTATAGPNLGAHNHEVFSQLGLQEKDISALRSEGVVA